uniref:Regulatory protein zeste n=1 Tax=Diabrotica virgifera virgifera TaxID=50390 RepID=A0A6P7GGK5_DIAVI
MSSAKRSRSVNFTKEEELLLIEEVSKYKAIIECKTTNKLNWNEKEKAWKKIVANFNAKNSNVRKLDQIRAKYDSLKCKARKDVAKLKNLSTGDWWWPLHQFYCRHQYRCCTRFNEFENGDGS